VSTFNSLKKFGVEKRNLEVGNWKIRSKFKSTIQKNTIVLSCVFAPAATSPRTTT